MTKSTSSTRTMSKVKILKELKELYLARALYDAIDDGNIKEVISLLNQNKANPNILLPEKHMNPFHLAAGHENSDFGKVATALILHHGGDPNICCDGNRTVLHVAVAWNHSSIVEILLKSSYIIPDPYIKDDDNLDVFNYAVKFNAWESLATLQSYVECPDNTNNSENLDIQFSRKMQLKDDSIFTAEEKSDKSIAESTFNTSDTLPTNNEHFSSCERLNSTFKSILDDNITSQSNSSVCNVEKLDNLKNNLTNGSIMSSISSIINDIECIENINFSTNHLLTNSEVYKFDEKEIIAKNNSSLPKINCSNINEYTPDLSMLSSYLGSDDYFTCPDSNPEKYILNTNKTEIQIEDVINNVSMTGFNDSKRSISNMEPNEDSNHYISSDESSSTEVIVDYDTDYLRQCLIKYGLSPGPLVSNTKRLYVKKLNKLKNQSKLKHDENHIHISSVGSYSSQLNKVLTVDEYDTWKLTLKSWRILENDIISNKNGESFTYLLIDPRITQNLPARADEISKPIKIWQTFISSIFYIGKGTNSRLNDHMNEAFNFWRGVNISKINPKIEYILSLWEQNMGVVCVQAFHYLTSKEAHIREAAMIDAIGVKNLTNEKCGSYYDSTKRWRNSDRCKLGCHLLYRAMLIFLADGERQIFHSSQDPK